MFLYGVSTVWLSKLQTAKVRLECKECNYVPISLCGIKVKEVLLGYFGGRNLLGILYVLTNSDYYHFYVIHIYF